MNKRVKTIIAALLTFSVMTSVACSKNDSSASVLGESRDSEATEATTTTAKTDSTILYSEIMGTYSGTTYTNLNSAVTIAAPEGWNHLNATEASSFWNNDENIRMATDTLAFNDIAYESVWKAANGDFMSVMLMYAPGASSDDYSAVLGTDDLETVTLGTKDVNVTYGSYDVDGNEIKTATVIDFNNDTMIIITINCFTDEDIQAVMDNITFN